MPHPIEVTFPDIEPWMHGNAGLPYVWRFDAEADGPHVCVCALMHGNEVCGAIAVERLLTAFVRDGLRPRRGRISLLFANVEAYRSFDPQWPLASRALDEDLNRVWDGATLDGTRVSRELTRARVLRPWIDTVDHLLDLHSMSEPSPPLVLAGDTPKGLALARAVGLSADIIVDSGHTAGRRLRDYGAFADSASPRSALLVECGQHWERDVGEFATEAAWRFLEHLDMVSRPNLAPAVRSAPAAPRIIDITDVVTVASADFRWTQSFPGLATVPLAGTLLALDGDRPVVTPYDDAILVMPSQTPKVGTTAVRIGRVRDTA